MKIVRGSKNWKKTRQPLGIALGNFDGVHCGHQAILKDLVSTARQKKWRTAVYTFDPHPAKILAPAMAPRLLQTIEQKLAALEQLGIDAVILEKFDKTFSQLSPQIFFEKILKSRLGAQGIWIGYDFTFGHKRMGNVETLRALCEKAGWLFRVRPAQFTQNTLVSSTQIRSLIANTQVDAARRLLGRPFALIGKVIRGHGLGGKLGIHTANLKVENELLPKMGIYVTTTKIGPWAMDHGPWAKKQKEWPSVTSVGFNPTFPGKGFSVETHLIGFKGNLRGKKIEVAFLKWLRDELTFPNEETLAAQIRKDIAEAKKFHETLRHHR